MDVSSKIPVPGILQFISVPIAKPREHPNHPCDDKNCTYILCKLLYDTEAHRKFRELPSHIVDLPNNWTLWRRFRHVISLTQLDDSDGHVLLPHEINNHELSNSDTSVQRLPVRLHLYPQLCALSSHSSTVCTDLCSNCHTMLRSREIPVPSIAAGWDFGSPELANLPELSFAEQLAVNRVRIYSTSLKFTLPTRPGKPTTITSYLPHTFALRSVCILNRNLSCIQRTLSRLSRFCS